MSVTRSRPTSVSSGSLMQDVSGALPVRYSHERDDDEEDQPACLSLSQAVHARRAEYIRPRHIRIKIGTWNVAAYKGAEKDVGGWFVEGKGVEEALTGLAVDEAESVQAEENGNKLDRESVESQEARYKKKKPTIPKNDVGVVPGNDDVALYVLGLQEVVDITSTAEALRPYSDPSVAKRWKDELASTLPPGYRLVAEQQLIGLLLLIYASPAIADDVKSVSTTSVGTGLMGYMGNKGAVTARLVIGDTTKLVFVNCHLAAGADKTALERRNWDASQIVQRTRFEPIKDAMDLSQPIGDQIGDEDFAFWVGDLNYRLQTIPGDDIRRLLMLHTRNEYDLHRQSIEKIDNEIEIATQALIHMRDNSAAGSAAESLRTISPRPSTDRTSVTTKGTSPTALSDVIDPNSDPASLQTTLSSILPHDELQQQMRLRKAFHDGWREGPITFLPTYKYDIGSVGVFDSSEKKRAPSWCDRILYRTRRDKTAYDAKVKDEQEAKKRDEEMKANGTDQAADDDDILYDYDPDADGTNFADELEEFDEYDALDGARKVVTKEGAEDEIRLDYYTAHQRVLSSDHKPLNAVFTLRYDSVIPDLKAKVHAEVAKELDKAENEGRPSVTVVVDQQNNKPLEQGDTSTKGFEGVDFGGVKWNQSVSRSLTIANTSWVPASLNFIERPVGSAQAAGVAPDWLHITVNDISFEGSSRKTDSITLDPGETASVALEIRVLDLSLVRELNEGTSGLDDTLVLRVEGGRDHFIPVRATWLETSLGRTIDKLIRIPEGGIRKLQNQRPDSSKSRELPDPASRPLSADAEGPVRFSAPRELFRLTEALEELAVRVVAEWDMIADESDVAPWLQHPGWPFDKDCWEQRSSEEWQDELSEACDALDTDRSLPASLPHEMPRMQQLYLLSNLLLVFLSGIPEGIIYESMWTQIDHYLANHEKAKQKPTEDEQRTAIQEILSQSPSHSISFTLLTTLLERLLQEIAGTIQAKEASAPSPTTKKVGGALRRVTGTFARAPPPSWQIEHARAALARIFADAIFEWRTVGARKLSPAQDRRKLELMELFLRKDTPG